MLALGVVVGAAIGPAPAASLAGERIPLLLPAIAALAGGAGAHDEHRHGAAVQPRRSRPSRRRSPSSADDGGRAHERRRDHVEDAPSAAATPAPKPSAA